MNKVYFVLLGPWFLIVPVYLVSNSQISVIHIRSCLQWCQLERLGEKKIDHCLFGSIFHPIQEAQGLWQYISEGNINANPPIATALSKGAFSSWTQPTSHLNGLTDPPHFSWRFIKYFENDHAGLDSAFLIADPGRLATSHQSKGMKEHMVATSGPLRRKEVE